MQNLAVWRAQSRVDGAAPCTPPHPTPPCLQRPHADVDLCHLALSAEVHLSSRRACRVQPRGGQVGERTPGRPASGREASSRCRVTSRRRSSSPHTACRVPLSRQTNGALWQDGRASCGPQPVRHDAPPPPHLGHPPVKRHWADAAAQPDSCAVGSSTLCAAFTACAPPPAAAAEALGRPPPPPCPGVDAASRRGRAPRRAAGACGRCP